MQLVLRSVVDVVVETSVVIVSWILVCMMTMQARWCPRHFFMPNKFVVLMTAHLRVL